jgi:hypothetical protein
MLNERFLWLAGSAFLGYLLSAAVIGLVAR